MELKFPDPTTLIEALAVQKALRERIQGLLTDLYPGLEVDYGPEGICVRGPETVLKRLNEAVTLYEDAKSVGKDP